MMLQRRPTPGLSLANILIRLGDVSLIELTADVPAGSVFTVMGPSGSGKSTLLSYVGGFLDPARLAAHCPRHPVQRAQLVGQAKTQI